jgi:hypothetical protein
MISLGITLLCVRHTFIATVTEDIDGDTDVRSDKVLVVPRHESVKALEDGEDDGEAEGKVCQVRLEWLGIS